METIGIKKRILAWIWPERCAFCNEVVTVGEACCAACAASVTPQELPLCHNCGKSKATCCCHGRKGATDGIVSVYVYQGVLKRTIQYIKRDNTPEQAAYLAQQIVQAVRREFPDVAFDAVTFVPRTRREKRRGNNASYVLAREVARQETLPCEAVLCKVRKTRMQKELSALERSGNLRGALDVRPTATVQDRTFLVVDDVCTTGATVRECALMLKIYGAKAVYAATLAGTVWDGKKE